MSEGWAGRVGETSRYRYRFAEFRMPMCALHSEWVAGLGLGLGWDEGGMLPAPWKQ